jgi:hypothetical protein
MDFRGEVKMGYWNKINKGRVSSCGEITCKLAFWGNYDNIFFDRIMFQTKPINLYQKGMTKK